MSEERRGSKVRIYLKILKRGILRDLDLLDVDPFKLLEFMRILRKYIRKSSIKILIGSKTVIILTRFKDIITGRNNTLLLTTKSKVNINKLPETSTYKKGSGLKSNSEADSKSNLKSERKKNRYNTK